MNEVKNMWKRTTGMFVMIVILIIILPISSAVIDVDLELDGLGYDDEGNQGEYPWKAIHPENACYADTVVCVYAKEKGYAQPPIHKIRIAISNNAGSNWFYEDVDNSDNDQDYPDVVILPCDYLDAEVQKIQVVWQEKINNVWVIKMKERIGLGPWPYGYWTDSIIISDMSQDNIYPKIDSTSVPEEGQESAQTWTNVVWQRYYPNTNTYGVKLFSMNMAANPTSQINDIGVPAQTVEEYRHPALSCLSYGMGLSGYTDIYLIYEYVDPVDDLRAQQIIVETVQIQAYSTSCTTLYSPLMLSYASRYSYFGFPDIYAVGSAGATGLIDCVWMESSNVKFCRSITGGQSWGNVVQISSNGCSGSLRCVAISVHTHRSFIVWTDGSDIRMNYIGKIFDPNLGYWDWESWNSNREYQHSQVGIDTFVDIALQLVTHHDEEPPEWPEETYTYYGHIDWQKNGQTIKYARDNTRL
ncbi:MAG: hypothetical protein QCI82_00665 [Candidatus Thermoplasmatota archaeon]|nr:hypothetical protein [Candidatus Thermoplasmatota archaeon]